ncbi:MAG: sigma 54-interacting transcriptional regulator, partial [Planctomycetes bacterium]|nr:sigma 54-interacting transcriptional regulator [Planctomycetota bacterium]
LLDALVVRAQQGRLVVAARHLKRVFALARRMEQDMSTTQRTVFRTLVVNRALEALESRLRQLLPERGRADDAAPTIQALRRIHEAENLPRALQAVVEGLFRLTKAVRVFLVRLDADGETEFLAAADRNGAELKDPQSEISRRILEEAFAQERPMLVADASAHQRLGFVPSVQRLGIVSVACVPLRSGTETLGMLYLDSPLEAAAFDEDDLPRLDAFASLAATALGLHLETANGGRERSLRRRISQQRVTIATRSRELSRARDRMGHGVVIGRSPALLAVNEVVRQVSSTTLSVLITGETGSGKELVAEAVHAGSPRRNRPFIAINCATLPGPLAESELFGHKKGAFTGAVKDAPGLFRLAHRGTLFLDEIGELDEALQAKLLRALESGHARPVGGTRDYQVDLRVVAATHRDLRDSGLFRQDLYFRLAQVVVEVPALRERVEDIPLLVHHFLDIGGKAGLRFEKEALDALMGYGWPGNVRELKNLVDRLALLAAADGVIRLSDLPEDVWNYRGAEPATLAEAEARTIAQALEYTGGERKAAAKLLGISRSTLYEKLARLGPKLADVD